MQTLKNSQTELKGIRVIVRCDLDVPMVNGEIQEKYRLEAGLPTLTYLLHKGAHVIIMGHMGRPDGKYVDKLSTRQLKPFYDQQLGANNYELLENLRFNPGEEANDLTFAQELASKADMYVNESFATSHRSHASMVGITNFIPSYAGLRLQTEVELLSQTLKNPIRPLIAIIGGAKLESKMPVIKKFLGVADKVLLGGKMGLSWKENIPSNLQLPSDYATDQKDIGPNTIADYAKQISQARKVIWSGPMGAFEDPQFAQGTIQIAQAILNAHIFSIVGGGDTVTALDSAHLLNNGFNFVSTGGSAMLDFISEGNLPALKALGYTNA